MQETERGMNNIKGDFKNWNWKISMNGLSQEEKPKNPLANQEKEQIYPQRKEWNQGYNDRSGRFFSLQNTVYNFMLKL